MAINRVFRGVPKYNIQIGPLCEAHKHNPSMVLSVTDYLETSLLGLQNYYWVPINELSKSWGYMPFFAAKRYLDYFCLEQKVPLVYVCCSAGVHRSPMTAFCWLLSLGLSPEQARDEFFGHFKEYQLIQYKNDLTHGYIPANLEEFYKIMNENPGWSYRSVLQNVLKYERVSYISDREAIRCL